MPINLLTYTLRLPCTKTAQSSNFLTQDSSTNEGTGADSRSHLHSYTFLVTSDPAQTHYIVLMFIIVACRILYEPWWVSWERTSCMLCPRLRLCQSRKKRCANVGIPRRQVTSKEKSVEKSTVCRSGVRI
jgi:hypothetical protein